MSSRHRNLVFGLLALLFAGACGCSILPESLQQHQLWKWNRWKGPSQDPFMLSVHDSVPLDALTPRSRPPQPGELAPSLESLAY